MGLQVDLYSVDGTTHVAKLMAADNVATMEELNNDGQLTLEVAKGSAGTVELLAAEEALVRVSLDGEPVAWGVLDRDGDDPTQDAGAIALTAPGTAALLLDAGVHADTPGAPERAFTTATPGRVMRTLLLEAQGRGALQGISWAFTDTHDSAGLAWTQQWTGTYEVGASLRAVLANLVELRLVDFRMVGLTLELYATDTVLDRDLPDLILLPEWLTEAPRERTRQGKVTHMQVLGDGGRVVEVTSGEPGRRREGFAQIGGIPDQGTLLLAGQAALAPVAKVQQGHTVTYLLGGERPRPWADYRVGDNIRRGDVRVPTGELEPLRVRSMSVALNDDGAQAVSLELNDVFLEAEVANKLRLDALTNGSIVGRPSTQYGVDNVKPAPPASVAVSSDVYPVGNGELLAQLTVSWPQVITNHDGTPTTDVAGYEIQYNIDGAGFGTAMYRTSAQQTSRDALPLGRPAQVRVRTVDRTGNYSDWQVSASITLAVDVAPPPKPSKPVVTSQLGLITVGWDGKAFDGTGMPNDLAAVEVWQSTTVGFTVGDLSSSLVDQIRPKGGEAAVRGTAYGQPVYFRLRPVDRSGNYGPVSDESVGSRQWVVEPDIGTGAVTTTKIANLAVNTAQIADLAVGDAKIINMSVGKVTAGLLHAQVVIAEGELIAGDPIAGRVSIKGPGLEAYSPLNNRTLLISSASGAVTVGPADQPQISLSSYGNWWNSNTLQAMVKFTHPNPLLWSEGNLFAQYWQDGSNHWAALRLQSPFAPGVDPYADAAYVDVRSRGDGHTEILLRADQAFLTASSVRFSSTDTSSVDFTLSNVDMNVFSFRSPNAGGIIDMQFSGGEFGNIQTIFASQNAYNGTAGAALRLQAGTLFLGSTTAGLDVQVSAAQQGTPWVGVVNRGGLRFGSDKVHVQDWFTDSWKILKVFSWETVSDPAMKQDAKPIPSGALDLVRRVKVYDYGVAGAPADARRFRGVMADELEQILPGAVTYDDDGGMAVDGYFMQSTTLAALQELAAVVDTLIP